jgi:hypothetical protein
VSRSRKKTPVIGIAKARRGATVRWKRYKARRVRRAVVRAIASEKWDDWTHPPNPNDWWDHPHDGRQWVPKDSRWARK